MHDGRPSMDALHASDGKSSSDSLCGGKILQSLLLLVPAATDDTAQRPKEHGREDCSIGHALLSFASQCKSHSAWPVAHVRYFGLDP